MNKIVLYMSICLFFCCKESAKNTTLSVIEITPEKAIKSGIKTSDFVGECRFTILEPAKEGHTASPDKIIKRNGRFYIKGLRDNYIAIFDNNGKFINSLKRQGRGPQEYITISDFGVDPTDGSIWVVDPVKVVVYDSEGRNFIRKVNIEEDMRRIKVTDKYLVGVSEYNQRAVVIDKKSGKVLCELARQHLGSRPIKYPVVDYGDTFALMPEGVNYLAVFDPESNTFTEGDVFTHPKAITRDIVTDMRKNLRQVIKHPDYAGYYKNTYYKMVDGRLFFSYSVGNESYIHIDRGGENGFDEYRTRPWGSVEEDIMPGLSHRFFRVQWCETDEDNVMLSLDKNDFKELLSEDLSVYRDPELVRSIASQLTSEHQYVMVECDLK